jgi:hypothetical protein
MQRDPRQEPAGGRLLAIDDETGELDDETFERGATARRRPAESDAEEAERIARDAGQDPWGEPEDQPDHRENEVYVQQDEADA